jgi:hypothetical protein
MSLVTRVLDWWHGPSRERAEVQQKLTRFDRVVAAQRRAMARRDEAALRAYREAHDR